MLYAAGRPAAGIRLLWQRTSSIYMSYIVYVYMLAACCISHDHNAYVLLLGRLIKCRARAQTFADRVQ